MGHIIVYPVRGPCFPSQGCTGVLCIHMQAVPLMSSGTQQLHWQRRCWQFEILWECTLPAFRTMHTNGCQIGISSCISIDINTFEPVPPDSLRGFWCLEARRGVWLCDCCDWLSRRSHDRKSCRSQGAIRSFPLATGNSFGSMLGARSRHNYVYSVLHSALRPTRRGAAYLHKLCVKWLMGLPGWGCMERMCILMQVNLVIAQGMHWYAHVSGA